MKKIRIFGALLIILSVIAILTVPNFTSAQSPQDEEVWLWVPTSPDGSGPLVKVKVKSASVKEREAMDDAPVVPDQHPEWNTCNPDSPYYNPRDRYWPPRTRFEFSGGKTSLLEHHWWGTDIKGGSSKTGAWATHQIDTSIEIKSGQFLYAPTLLASNYCPLEAVTAYWEKTKRAWRVYGHINGECRVTNYFTDSWVDAHVRNWNGVPCYDSRALKLAGYWYIQLYNWNDGQWENKDEAHMSNGREVGWEDWEEYEMKGNWPTLPKINCFNLEVRVNTSWENVDSDYGDEDDSHTCEGFPPHDFYHEFYAWWVGPKA